MEGVFERPTNLGLKLVRERCRPSSPTERNRLPKAFTNRAARSATFDVLLHGCTSLRSDLTLQVPGERRLDLGTWSSGPGDGRLWGWGERPQSCPHLRARAM